MPVFKTSCKFILAGAALFSITALPAVAADAVFPEDAEPATTQPAALQPAACTLIDTDFDIDDMMAIPLVIGNRYVAGIVTSEGYTLPPDGAAALSRFIAEPGQRHIPVIMGASINLPDSKIKSDWGQFVLDYRSMMGSAFALLATDLPPAVASSKDYVKEVQKSVAECDSVDVLLIGTFTSFINYSPAIRDKIKNVVIMGMPLRGDPTQKPGNFSFNCEYDMNACKIAFEQQLPGLTHFFVDPPRTDLDKTPVGHQEKVYGPTLAMVEGLEPRGLPNALKQALVGIVRDGSLGPSVKGADYWAIDCCFKAGGKSLLWDQMAALFLVHPEAFNQVGGPEGHFEPTISADDVRALWTKATNKAVDYVDPPASK